MCELCGGYPCRGGCPNEPELRRIYICHECREDISEGDEYIDFSGTKMCKRCVEHMIEDMSVDEVLKLAGFYYEKAEYIPLYEED